jgi:hypothetical protein
VVRNIAQWIAVNCGEVLADLFTNPREWIRQPASATRPGSAILFEAADKRALFATWKLAPRRYRQAGNATCRNSEKY